MSSNLSQVSEGRPIAIVEDGTVALVTVFGASVADPLGSVKVALFALEKFLTHMLLTMLHERASRHQLEEVFMLLGLCERDLIRVDTCMRN